LTASHATPSRKQRMPAPHPLRLGVNIDHVATVRNARGGKLPDPLRAARIAEAAGADGITAHLREDRRHIVDGDIEGLMRELKVPLNFEMAATPEMVDIALRHQPHAACIVPEKREERTTEGGLDAAGQHNHLKPMVARLRAAERNGLELRTNGVVVAQVWRDPTGRQAELARLLRSVDVKAVDEYDGRDAGVLLAGAAAGDAVDATVVVLAVAGDRILTSDPGDIRALVAVSGRAILVVPC